MFSCARTIGVFVTAAVFAVGLQAQRTPMRPGPEMQPIRADSMTNADVISLVGAGLDESIIVSKIRSSKSTTFDTSVDGLKALKAGGVTPEEMHAMLESTSSSAGYSNSDDPTQMHQPGVYVQVAGHDGQAHLLLLEHTQAVGQKGSRSALANVGSGLQMIAPLPGLGAGKTHVHTELNGPRSPVQIDDRNPNFYIYIQQDTQRFGGADMSSRDFTLLKMHVKSSVREVEISTVPGMSYGMGTSSSGIEDKAREVTTTQMIKPGIYMVKLIKPLKPGEYAFEHLLENIFYDFGVTEAH